MKHWLLLLCLSVSSWAAVGGVARGVPMYVGVVSDPQGYCLYISISSDGTTFNNTAGFRYCPTEGVRNANMIQTWGRIFIVYSPFFDATGRYLKVVEANTQTRAVTAVVTLTLAAPASPNILNEPHWVRGNGSTPPSIIVGDETTHGVWETHPPSADPSTWGSGWSSAAVITDGTSNLDQGNTFVCYDPTQVRPYRMFFDPDAGALGGLTAGKYYQRTATAASGPYNSPVDTGIVTGFSGGNGDTQNCIVKPNGTYRLYISNGNLISGVIRWYESTDKGVTFGSAQQLTMNGPRTLNWMQVALMDLPLYWRIYKYHAPVTISSTMVDTADQTNFTVLVSLSHATLKSVNNGGNVANDDGSDIGFWADTTNSVYLQHDLASYDPVNGVVLAWVWPGATLSHSSNTTIYMHYGASTIPSGSPVNISGYAYDVATLAVHHLDGSLTLTDSSNGGYTLTNNGTATSVAGKVGNGASLNGTTQYLSRATWGPFAGPFGTPASVSQPAALSVSGWYNFTSFPANVGGSGYTALFGSHPNPGATDYFDFLVARTDSTHGKLALYLHATTGLNIDPASTTLTTSTWYFLSATYDSTNGLKVYVNGVQDGTSAANGTLSHSNTNILEDGQDTPFTPRFGNFIIDERRVDGCDHTGCTARGASWFKTMYNNQSSPGTYVTKGAEVAH